jgi:hypothetical protein
MECGKFELTLALQFHRRTESFWNYLQPQVLFGDMDFCRIDIAHFSRVTERNGGPKNCKFWVAHKKWAVSMLQKPSLSATSRMETHLPVR